MSRTRCIHSRVVMVEDVPAFAVVALLEHLRTVAQKHGHSMATEARCTVELEVEGDDLAAFHRMSTELFERGILLEDVSR